MNWLAIGSLSQLGLLILTWFTLTNPQLNYTSKSVILFAIGILCVLIIYNKLFRLIRKGSGPAVYKVVWGVKHWIENPYTLKKLGHTADDVESINEFEFNLHPLGKSINLRPKDEPSNQDIEALLRQDLIDEVFRLGYNTGGGKPYNNLSNVQIRRNKKGKVESVQYDEN